MVDPSNLADAIWWVSWIKFAKKVAGALVVAGVAGELLGDVFEAPHEKVIEADRAEKSELAAREIADANARAAALEKQAAELTKQAAELTKKAEEDHLARVKLEKSLLGRSLSIEQSNELANSLSRFPDTGVMLIQALPGSEEIRLATLGILNVLQNAHWRVTLTEARRSLPVFGVWIELSPDANEQTTESARVLARGLQAAGWETQGPFQWTEQIGPIDPALRPMPSPLVQITVGFHRYLPPPDKQ